MGARAGVARCPREPVAEGTSYALACAHVDPTPPRSAPGADGFVLAVDHSPVAWPAERRPCTEARQRTAAGGGQRDARWKREVRRRDVRPTREVRVVQRDDSGLAEFVVRHSLRGQQVLPGGQDVHDDLRRPRRGVPMTPQATDAALRTRCSYSPQAPPRRDRGRASRLRGAVPRPVLRGRRRARDEGGDDRDLGVLRPAPRPLIM